MNQHLVPGVRRALPQPALLVANSAERAVRLQQAIDDPQQVWLLQEFDGRVFHTAGTGRGPAERAAYLAGQKPTVPGHAGLTHTPQDL